MKLAVYDQPEIFQTLKPEWNTLLHRSDVDKVFLTWEWQSTWWEAYQPGELWVVTCRDDNENLIAIAPWFIETNAQNERVVRTIGCVDVTDYMDVIVEAEQRVPVLDCMAHHLRAHTERYDRINFCNIPEHSPNLRPFSTALKNAGFDVEITFQEVCPIIALPETYEDYLNTLDKKQRHELRRKVRRAESEATVEWYTVGPDHNLETEVNNFLELMASSQQQKAEFLSNPRNVRFFQQMAEKTMAEGWLQLNFLKVNGTLTAAYCNFDYNGAIQVYNSGLKPDTYGHLSPGIVLLVYNIQHAIETGHQMFDFLRGNETYKYRMGAQDTQVFKLRAQLPN